MDSFIQVFTIYAIPVVFAITLHEAAHGYVARMFGDPTAHLAGRITLNPLVHIDPVGTILVPISLLVVSAVVGGGNFLFGWAKPVPVDFARLRHPKRDMLWVAIAGPAANLVMAIGWALLFKFANFLPDAYVEPMRLMCEAGIQINAVLMVLNLLPIPPLDGGRIMVSILPVGLAERYARIELFGFFILLFLLFSGVLGSVLRPLVYYFKYFLSVIFQF